MEVWNDNGQEMAYHRFGDGERLFIWAHGWGQSYQALLPLAQSLPKAGEHCLIDFPGFGQSPIPDRDWSVGDYADSMNRFLQEIYPGRQCIWIGHSFGCRIGVKMAACHRDQVRALCLMAGAGLPARRSRISRWRSLVRVWVYKLLKHLVWSEESRERLRTYFGSADYVNAGALRGTFLKVIGENLSEDARRVQCPVQLIYGENDSETPPDIGQLYHRLIAGSHLRILPHLDHYSIIGSGRHQALYVLKEFLELVESIEKLEKQGGLT